MEEKFVDGERAVVAWPSRHLAPSGGAIKPIDIEEATVLYSFFSFFKKNDVFTGYV